MNGVNIENFSRTNHGGDIEVTLSRRRWPNTGGFVSETHVQRITINIAVDRHCLDPHFLASPDYATSNFPTIGDQNLLKFATCRWHLLRFQNLTSNVLRSRTGTWTLDVSATNSYLLIPKSGWPYSTG